MSTTDKAKLLKNGLFNSGSWIVTAIIAMVATPYFVYKLSAEGYGIYVLLTGFLGYYGLLDLGFGQGVTKYVAEYHAANNTTALRRSINAALMVQVVVGGLGSTFLILEADFILELINIPPGLMGISRTGLYVSAVGFLFTMLAGTLNSALMGLQLFGITSKISAAMNFALTLLVALALAMGLGLLSAIVLTAGSAVVMLVVYSVVLREHLPEFHFAFDFDFREFKALGSFSGYMFLTKVSSIFGQYVVRFIVSSFLGPAAVTLFTVPAKLTNAISGLLYSGFGVLFPFASELGQMKNRTLAQQTFESGTRYFAAFAVPLFVFVMIAARPLLSIWMGQRFSDEGWYVLSLLSASALLASITIVPNVVTMGLGHSRLVGLFSLATIGAYSILLPIMTSWSGLLGTCWAMVGACVPGLFLVACEAKYVVNLETRRFIAESVGIHVLPVTLAAFLMLIQYRLGLGNDLSVLLAVVFTGVYFIVLILRGYLPLFKWLRALRDSSSPA